MQEMQETWVQSLGQKDHMEKGMAIQSSILAWRTPWTEEPGRLQSMGLQRVRHDCAGILDTLFLLMASIIPVGFLYSFAFFFSSDWIISTDLCFISLSLLLGQVCFFKTFCFILKYSQLTILWYLQVNGKETQPYIYVCVYPFFHKLPSHAGCHIPFSRVPCAVQ